MRYERLLRHAFGLGCCAIALLGLARVLGLLAPEAALAGMFGVIGLLLIATRRTG